MLRARPGRAFATLIVCLAASCLGAASAQAQPVTLPLLPLARGHLEVLLGDPPQWLPVSGRPLTVTLFSGRAAPRHPAGLTAYVALQNASRSCGASVARDHAGQVIEFPDYYSGSDLIAHEQSLYAPQGGAAPGDYATEQPAVTVRQRGTTRACVWLAHKASQRGLVLSQEIPLLNGLFAASVSASPSAASAGGDAYSLNAIGVERTFDYSAATDTCGTVYTDPQTAVAAGSVGNEAISYGADSCSSDHTTFTFTRPSGATFGSLTYTVEQAESTPPEVSSIGACELDGLTVTSVTVASQYVQDVGCTVGRLLMTPYQSGFPRGSVLEAQVDGGVADIAPAGTAVDLVLNGT
jgi:hypothetical protein